jgi:hypothetical protein
MLVRITLALGSILLVVSSPLNPPPSPQFILGQGIARLCTLADETTAPGPLLLSVTERSVALTCSGTEFIIRKSHTPASVVPP